MKGKDMVPNDFLSIVPDDDSYAYEIISVAFNI